MQCLTEATLSDLAFNDDTDAPRDAEQHIEECPACAARLSEFRTIAQGLQRAADMKLNSQLSDHCLSENYLAEYLDNVLPEHQRDAVEAHLAECQRCVRTLTEARACLDDALPSAVAYVIQRIGEGLELIRKPATGFSLLDHNPVTVLGPGVEEQKIYSWSQELDDSVVLFDVQRHREGQVSVHLTLKQMVAYEEPTRLVVRQGGSIVQAETLPNSGEAYLDDLDAESYEIEFLTSEQQVGPIALTIE